MQPTVSTAPWSLVCTSGFLFPRSRYKIVDFSPVIRCGNRFRCTWAWLVKDRCAISLNKILMVAFGKEGLLYIAYKRSFVKKKDRKSTRGQNKNTNPIQLRVAVYDNVIHDTTFYSKFLLRYWRHQTVWLSTYRAVLLHLQHIEIITHSKLNSRTTITHTRATFFPHP